MQNEVLVLHVWVLVDVVDTLGIEQGSATLDAVHLVAFFKEKLGEVGTVLAGDAGDQRFLSIHFDVVQFC